jgi:hypothetical protein
MVTDVRPEFVRYRDVGCDLHSACLTCPLPVCKEELSHGSRAVRARMRGLQIALLASEGHSVRWIAQVMGVTTRSIYKSMALGKSSELNSLTDTDRCVKMSTAAHSVATNGR